MYRLEICLYIVRLQCDVRSTIWFTLNDTETLARYSIGGIMSQNLSTNQLND